MTDGQQIALSVAPPLLPTLTLLVAILLNNRQIDALRSEISAFRSEINTRFDLMDKLFTERLRRVEEVIDARLKHMERT